MGARREDGGGGGAWEITVEDGGGGGAWEITVEDGGGGGAWGDVGGREWGHEEGQKQKERVSTPGWLRVAPVERR